MRLSTTHATAVMIVPRATRSNQRPNLPWGFRFGGATEAGYIFGPWWRRDHGIETEVSCALGDCQA
jgi:hypothetical protein